MSLAANFSQKGHTVDELIPLTEFDKRYFPEISEDEKINFIVYSNEFERIFMKFEQVQSFLLIPQKAPPAVQGQMRLLNLAFELAQNPELIPKASKINSSSFNNLFPWFTKLHKNLMYDFSRKGEELLNEVDYPKTEELGTFRQENKKLGSRLMPVPSSIKDLLSQSFKEYSLVYDKYREDLYSPRAIEHSDWLLIEKAAHKTALSICCIKPFQDGSNRVARVVENLLRLNTGLKFRIFTDKNLFLNEIWELQDSQYNSV